METKKKSSKKIVIVIGGLLLVCLCILIIIAFSNKDKTAVSSLASATIAEQSVTENTNSEEKVNTQISTNTPKPTNTPEPTRAPTSTPDPNIISAGVYLVNTEIQPGVYRGMGSCYWQRLSDLSGNFEAIIANNNTEGQFYVEVKDSDFAFDIDCPIYPLSALPEPSGSLPTTYEAGTYLLGRDIQPGIYRGDGSCYWERLQDVTGTFNGIIANDNTNGQFYVEIKDSDYAFHVDCEVMTLDSVPVSSGDFPKNIEPGIYLVRRDIQPGIYKGEGSCYWERLSSVDGTFNSINANDNTNGQFYIEISSSDYALNTSCALELTEN